MKKYLLILLLCCSAGFLHAQVSIGNTEINYAHAAEYEIADITVSSNSPQIDKDYVIFISGLARGERVDMPGPAFSNAIKKLWEEKVFSDVRITLTKRLEDKIFLDIYVEERPRLSKFGFKGIRKGDVDNIRDIIKLFRGEVVTENLKRTTILKVKDYLYDKGYLAASVDIIEKPDSAAGMANVILDIVINKGEKVRIADIDIIGNNKLDDYQVKKAMKKTFTATDINIHRDFWNFVTHPRKVSRQINAEEEKYGFPGMIVKYFVSRNRINLFKSSKFVEDDYQADKDAIIKKYNKLGYRDARILDDSVIYKGSDMYIKIFIEEGTQFFIRNIDWVGNTKYKTEDLQKIMNINRGDVYDQERIDQALNFNPNGLDISTLYQDNGYLFFQITPVETAVDGDSIDLEMRIYEGKQARINRVTVTGNTKTSDHVILREIRTQPGDLFSRSNVIRTQQELGALGYFNPQAMNVVPRPNPQDGTVDLEYVVQEQPNDQVELSGGWGNRMLVGTAGVTFNNFSTRNIFKKSAWKPLPAGDGQRLSLRIMSNGQWFQSYNFSFTEPWLGGKKPISFSISAFHSMNTNSIGFSNVGNSGRIMATSASISVGKRLKWPDDFFSIFATLKWERYNLRNFAIIPNYNNGTSHKVSLTLQINRSSINDNIFPTRGSEILISGEITPPYSAFMPGRNYLNETIQEKYKLLEYHKWKLSLKFYSGLGSKKKTSEKFVIFNRFDFGALGVYNKDLGYSPFERFQLGGDGLSAIGFQNQFLGREIIALRGYQNGALTPGYPNPSGGVVYTKLTTELRYLVSGNPSAKIFVLAFMEAGNAWDSFRDFSPFRVNRSVGGGVRIFLPMFGLMGVDYGWGFDPIRNTPEQNRQKGVFHFMIGQQF